MRRQKRKSKSSSKIQNVDFPPSSKPAKGMNRRDFIGNLSIYGAAVVVAGGGTVYFGRQVMASAKETDLSTIGNGVPAIVQIHDPSCPTCTALQREARDAACEFAEGELQFLVANLHTEEGRRLATANGVGKITLLLFDGKGQRQGVLHGLNSAENLKPVFENHAKRYGAKTS